MIDTKVTALRLELVLCGSQKRSTLSTRVFVDWLDAHKLIPHSDHYVSFTDDYAAFVSDYENYIGKGGNPSINYLLELPDEELNALIAAWVLSGDGAKDED